MIKESKRTISIGTRSTILLINCDFNINSADKYKNFKMLPPVGGGKISIYNLIFSWQMKYQNHSIKNAFKMSNDSD